MVVVLDVLDTVVVVERVGVVAVVVLDVLVVEITGDVDPEATETKIM